jgi:hypothetical protein
VPNIRVAVVDPQDAYRAAAVEALTQVGFEAQGAKQLGRRTIAADCVVMHVQLDDAWEALARQVKDLVVVALVERPAGGQRPVRQAMLVRVCDSLGDAADHGQSREEVRVRVRVHPVVEPHGLRVVGIERDEATRVLREVVGAFDAWMVELCQQAELPLGRAVDRLALGLVGCATKQVQPRPLIDAGNLVAGAVVLPGFPLVQQLQQLVVPGVAVLLGLADVRRLHRPRDRRGQRSVDACASAGVDFLEVSDQTRQPVRLLFAVGGVGAEHPSATAVLERHLEMR